MNPLRQILRGVAALFSPGRADADMDDEVRDFVQRRSSELTREGLPYHEALRHATVEIGNVTVTREQVRASGWEHGVETLLTDARYALRRLRRDPAFTLVASLTLALGIGARQRFSARSTRSCFARCRIPVQNASWRSAIAHQSGARSRADVWNLRGTCDSQPVIRDAERDRPLAPLTDRNRRSGTPPGTTRQRERTFTRLACCPLIGRSFDNTEDIPGAGRVAVLSDRLVKRRFGGDGSMVGASITLNGEPHASSESWRPGSWTSWRQPPTSGRHCRHSRTHRLTRASGAITTGSSAG